MTELKNTTTLNESMKNQIISMLKNVITDDTHEDTTYDELRDSLFNEDDDDEDTCANSNLSSSRVTINALFFNRQDNQRFSTTKYASTLVIPEVVRSNKKFQTTNIENHSMSIDSDVEVTKKIKTVGNHKFKLNEKFLDELDCQLSDEEDNLCSNCIIEHVEDVTTPKSAKPMKHVTMSPGSPMMPLRTFTFKNSYMKQTEANADKIPIIPLVKEKHIQNRKNNMTFFDLLSIQLESMLVQSKRFTWDIYMKMKGHFIYLIKNQQTSRLCQYFFDETPQEMIQLIFDEIKDQIDSLLLDPYANYFCLKIFYFLNLNDRLFFLNKISSTFDILSTNKISTYPIQCIVEKLTLPQEQIIIVNALKDKVVTLSLNMYGTHVLKRVMTTFDYRLLSSISQSILENFIYLANNPNGLCVVKQEIILEKNRTHFETLKQIISANSLLLIQNPYGNYALQAVADNWDVKDAEMIMSTFLGKLVVLSLQKYSSNVIEKCLEKSVLFLQSFIKEIFSVGMTTLPILLKNNYGHYVIQTVIKCLPNSPFRATLLSEIKRIVVLLNDKKVSYKWKKMISCL